MTHRPYIKKAIRLAAALSELAYLRGEGLPFDVLKTLSAEQFLARYELDHVVYHTWDPVVPHFTNLTFMLVAKHREKTRRDVKEIAKVRRGLKKRAAAEQSKPKHAMPGSLGSGWKKKLSGRVERRV